MAALRSFPALLVSCVAILPAAVGWSADEPAGAAIYRRHCERCHGVEGRGTEEVPAALVGERSVGQLAALVDETMPQDDPAAIGADEAREVAAWIHASF